MSDFSVTAKDIKDLPEKVISELTKPNLAKIIIEQQSKITALEQQLREEKILKNDLKKINSTLFTKGEI